jgi:hypothetical protein
MLSSPIAPPWTDRGTPFYCHFSSSDELHPVRPSSTRPGSRRPHHYAPPRLLRSGELRCSEADRPRSNSHGFTRLPPASRRSCSRVDVQHHEFATHLDGWHKVVRISKRKRKRFAIERVAPTGYFFFSEGVSRSGRPLLQLLHGGPCRVPVPQSIMLFSIPRARTSGQGLCLPAPLFDLSSKWFSRQRLDSTSAICMLVLSPTCVDAPGVVTFTIFGPSSLTGVPLYRGAGLASPIRLFR